MSQGMKREMPEASQVEDLVVLVLKSSRLHVTSQGIGDNHATVDVVLARRLAIALLDCFPVHQVLHNSGKNRNGADRILGFGALYHDFGLALPWRDCTTLLQAVQCPAYVQ